VLEEGSHSGKASGIVPDSFRVARQLLNRLEVQTALSMSHQSILTGFHHSL
jgi:hypothetical protein